MSYDWFVESEHLNRPHEIFEECRPYFAVARTRYFPLFVPLVSVNLVIGLEFSKP
jgi:hypothetical protein